MRKSRFTEQQISYALKQAQTGTPVAEVIRKMGITEQTFYRWKKQYGGMGVTSLLNEAIEIKIEDDTAVISRFEIPQNSQ